MVMVYDTYRIYTFSVYDERVMLWYLIVASSAAQFVIYYTPKIAYQKRYKFIYELSPYVFLSFSLLLIICCV